MSKITKLFQSVPVEQQKASSFDMSHYSLGSAKCGQLVPVFKQEIIPGDLITLGLMSQIDLPPMATAFMGRIDMRYEAFFVPNRICWGGWQDYMTKQSDDPYSRTIERSSVLPFITSSSTGGVQNLARLIGRSTLFDYLGFRYDGNFTKPDLFHTNFLGKKNVLVDNALPFLAYHRIYDDWYRNSQVMNPLFVRRLSTSEESTLMSYPWLQFNDTSNIAELDLDSAEFFNGDKLYTIHQRCWADDRFTTCALYPSASINPVGAAVTASSTSQGSDQVTIPNLRAANILQRYKEMKNLAGERYPDQLFAEYGVRPADAILDRPLFLGSFSHGVYTSAIFNNTPTDKGNAKNPFSNQLGSSAGDTSGFGKDSLIKGFKATEHGYVIVIASLVPHSFYSNGIDSDLLHSQIGDIASPKLQGLGEQPVWTSEVLGRYTIPHVSDIHASPAFGYSPQYSAYKYRNDEVHGELRDTKYPDKPSDGAAIFPTPIEFGTGSLRAFVLQRSIKGEIESISSAFLEIPTDFLDQVFAATTANSGYSYMWFIQWQLVMTRPLAEYTIPTLGDPKDTYTTRIPLRGTQLKG